MLLLDLDGFKLVNDRYGHLVGDAVLAEVAGRLQRLIGDRGVVARIGGDEFGLLLHAPIDEGTAAAFAAAAAQAVSAEPVSVQGEWVWLEATVGAALLDGERVPEDALRRADERMYLAKRRSGSDPFDRVSELIVGLLRAGAEGIEQALAAGLAEAAEADLVYVHYPGGEQWWPRPLAEEDAQPLRALAGLAHARDEMVEGKWRLAGPLRANDGPIGAFAVVRETPFEKPDRIALARAGVALGLALQRIEESAAARQQIRDLKALAYQDENTGLANRRALLTELERRSNDTVLSLLFIDFDGLRTVNNQLTYEHGNTLLRAVAAEIEGSLAPGELAARLHGSGGDEFIVVCPAVDQDEASRRAEQLERELQAVVLPAPIAALYRGASVGYALRADGEPTLALLERAATLMRERKRQRKAPPAA